MTGKVNRWSPRREVSLQEKFLLKRLGRVRKLFGFLRTHRHTLFDENFQDELAAMYRGAGRAPVAPAMMAMATLLQAYVGASDAEAVELTVVDLRWQMVLGCLGATEPAFSQGALHDFRYRLIRTGMDRRLLERTVELARQTSGFDWKKLPKDLRVAMDSSPLEGAGRVEDTINLLGHAARQVVTCIAGAIGWEVDDVCRAAGIPILLESSIKRALDCEWSDPEQKHNALQVLVDQLDSLQHWVKGRVPEDVLQEPALREALHTLAQIATQNLEPDAGRGGKKRIHQGTAATAASRSS